MRAISLIRIEARNSNHSTCLPGLRKNLLK